MSSIALPVPWEAGGFAVFLRLLMEGAINQLPPFMFAEPSDSAASAQRAPSTRDDLLADVALVGAVLRRDRKATAEFVQRFSGPVVHFLASRLAPRTDMIEDLAQEVFLTAWQRLGSYQGVSSLESWLVGIARHKVEDHYRACLRRTEPWDEVDEQIGHPIIDALEIRLDQERVGQKAAAILELLPEQYRVILRWRYWDKRSTRDIAAAVERSEKAVERLLARARKQFKDRWKHA